MNYPSVPSNLGIRLVSIQNNNHHCAVPSFYPDNLAILECGDIYLTTSQTYIAWHESVEKVWEEACYQACQWESLDITETNLSNPRVLSRANKLINEIGWWER